jgi:hypothetical protein
VRQLGARDDAPAAMERVVRLAHKRVVRLAHKLDARAMLGACESFLLDGGPGGWSAGIGPFTNMAFELQLERLRPRAAANALANMLRSGDCDAAVDRLAEEPVRAVCKALSRLVVSNRDSMQRKFGDGDFERWAEMYAHWMSEVIQEFAMRRPRGRAAASSQTPHPGRAGARCRFCTVNEGRRRFRSESDN